MLTLQSLGAAEEVTGSCHLLRVGDRRILLDCGLFQGSKKDEARNFEPLPFDTASIDAVVLSHAHIDHSGRIPLLVKQGYCGPIYTHKATRDLCQVMLTDAAFLNERDAEWENRKRERKGLAPVEPLYTMSEAAASMRQFKSLGYDRFTTILPGIRIRLRDAGHILGSAIVELWVSEAGRETKIVFSGDLGHPEAPILRNPATVEDADVVLMESTYGDRVHRSWEASREELTAIIKDANSTKGNILIPAFAVGRSQLVMYWMAAHFDEAALDEWHIFLDSPMAIQATRVYTTHSDLYDEQAKTLWQSHQRNSLLPNLHMTRTMNQSKAINRIRSGAIIIAGSGMCTGGRIKHHLLNNVWRKQCHVIIVGFQAWGTLGRALVDGASHIRLWGETVRVAAKVHTVGGLSAHADQRGLIDWYSSFKGRPPVYLVHGESRAQLALAQQLREECTASVAIVTADQTIDLQGQRSRTPQVA